MGKRLLFLLLVGLSSVAIAMAAGKKFTLVIDPGHGGHDPGAKGAVAYEKNINLKVALAFGRYVERNCPDVNVIYTSKTDVFIPLSERAAIANRNKADLFISIHSNSLPAGKISRGFETYTLGMHRAADNLEVAKRENSVILIEQNYQQRYAGFDPRSSESYIMFELMQDKNSCLIELGFISTPDEEEFLNSSSGQDLLAHGIFNAFVKYKNKFGGGRQAAVSVDRTADDNRDAVQTERRSSRRSHREQMASTRQTQQTQQPQPTQRQTQASMPQQFVSSVESVEQPQYPSQTHISEAQPVFKVQILSSNRSLRPGSAQFQGVENVESFKEGGSVKYTVGASDDYNEMARLRRSLLDKFPEAFVVAFRGGEKMDINEAIRMFRENN